MAYLLPSYLQKRLLRYALTRLDVIETDDLDLDNLGLTFGQRSVVELKNASIKVDKLAERASLPTSIVVEHASIRLLRLIIPADLHVSGVVVEVEGVDLRIEIQPDDKEKTAYHKKRQQKGPSHTDRANRPRISTPPTHDPGGIGHHIDISRVLPSSRDLAASFLESEPVEEKLELEAALGSQSRLQESTMSSVSADESEIGMAGGLTLPSFVANFFQGVADRLSVAIKDVSATIQVPLSLDDSEPVAFTLKLGIVSVDAISSANNDPDPSATVRKISVEDVRFGLEAEHDPLSEASSPRLGRRSIAEAVALRGHDGAASSLPSRSSTLDPEIAEQVPDSGTSLTNLQSPTSIGFRASVPASPASSTVLQPASNDPISTLLLSSHSFGSQIDNKAHAQLHSSAGAPSPESERTSASSDSKKQLSESRLYTHEEAESMYMSAISGTGTTHSTTRAMPGGWEWSDAVSHQDDRQAVPEPEQRPETPRLQRSIVSTGTGVPESDAAETSALKFQHPLLDRKRTYDSKSEVPSTVFMQIMRLDSLSLTVPTALRPPEQEQGPMDLRRDIPSSSPQSSRRVVMEEARTSLAYSTIGQPAAEYAQPLSPSRIAVQAGTLTIDVDLRVCKLVVRVAQALIRQLPNDVSFARKGPDEATTLSGNITFRLESLTVNFRETPNLSTDRNPSSQSSAASLRDEPMLCLSLSSISYSQNSPKLKTLTIAKITVRHTSTNVLSFVETVNVRDSIASSAVLRPHDVSVVIMDGRVEVQIKPVHVILDLLLVDEVLSRSGGLSSLIDLGNSIASTTTITKGTAPVKPASQQRTVRFNDRHPRDTSQSDPSTFGSKINVRLGGSIIDLVGSDASIKVKSSAVKLAWRDGQARAVIDGVTVDGPLRLSAKSPADVHVTAKSLEVRYLDAPEETDLDRLISLITPSSDRYDDDDDDIMVDTLLRQRRKGSVLRLSLAEAKIHARGLEWQASLVKLSDEIGKLSSVAKYLPEDDRPGILTFALINKFDCRVDLDRAFGSLMLQAELIEGAHINVPSLAAAQVSSWALARGEKDVMIGEVLSQSDLVMGPPMLMCRFLADEMDPTVRLKLSNTCLEYKVSTIIALTDLIERLEKSKTHSTSTKDVLSGQSSPSASSSSEDSTSFIRKVKVSIAFRDSAIALHPSGNPAKGLFVLSDAIIGYNAQKKHSTVSLELKKASLLIINNTELLGEGVTNADQKIYFDQNDQIQQLAKHGFVPVGTMSSASATVIISKNKVTNEQHLEVGFRNNLLFLETCADSTQTLIQILSGLSPPTPPSTRAKYRTEIVSIQDMLASFTGNAFVTEPGPELGLQASQITTISSKSDQEQDDEEYDDGGFMNDLYGEGDEADDEMTASYVESEVAKSAASLHIAPVQITAPNEEDLAQSMIAHSMLDFRTDHFATKASAEGTAHRWDSTKNTYGLASDLEFKSSPVKVKIRDVHIIWNLFDGYDWQATRDTISHAVKEIETKAMMRRPRSNTRSPAGDDDREDVIGDVLFNSIYISVPAHKDPRDLTSAINHEIDDLVSETGSYATGTTVTASPTRRQSGQNLRPKKLKLNRSKHHKMSFELEGVSADIVVFPPNGGEVQSSVDVRVRKLEIFDHLPTSTWRKFATYLHEAGEREMDTSMVHLELLNVKPVADLDASEIVMKLTILPLRLHVDQDALDFLARFFEFKDDSISPSIAPSAPPFIQRAEVNPVRLRLDYKPKKVDYAGLRSGRTTEFMNFIVLDRADMVLRRVILYGVSGFDRLGIMLNNIWSPDVRRNQLANVLSGLAPIRPLVDVASGVRDLVAVPIREYKKDGRIVRSIQKGAIAFAKTTSTELVNLGAKLAIGTQQILENAEVMLVPAETPEVDDEAQKQRSLYADQPLGIVQGLRGAYASLERDLLLARDAIVAVPGEVMASESATGAARAVLRQSPTIILRPAIGATKAVGQTLLGAGNTLDKRNLRRIDDKYKRY